MSATLLGHIDWGKNKDEDGLPEYFVDWAIRTTSTKDGPAMVEACPGLPLPGSLWQIGHDNDPTVFCSPELTIAKRFVKNEPDVHWVVKQKFNNKRTDGQKLNNPLLEPPRWSGGFIDRTKAVKDLIALTVRLDENGIETPVLRPVSALLDPQIYIYRGPITTTWEPITGKVTEFESGGPTVQIEMSLAELPLTDIATMYKTVNASSMWGLGPRTIKLSRATWQRKTYNSNSTFYYIVTYEFEIDYNTWDRYAENKGTRCLIGHSPGSQDEAVDPLGFDDANLDEFGLGRPMWMNPDNFEVYKDTHGENLTEPILMDLYGSPVMHAFEEDPVYQKLMYYRESNFLDLGIPPVIPTGGM